MLTYFQAVIFKVQIFISISKWILVQIITKFIFTISKKLDSVEIKSWVTIEGKKFQWSPYDNYYLPNEMFIIIRIENKQIYNTINQESNFKVKRNKQRTGFDINIFHLVAVVFL